MNRHWVLRPLTVLALAVTLGCSGDVTGTGDIADAELSARVTEPTGSLYEPGTYSLELDGTYRDAILYIPPGYDPAVPAPLVVLFHGAGGSADNWQSPYEHAV